MTRSLVIFGAVLILIFGISGVVNAKDVESDLVGSQVGVVPTSIKTTPDYIEISVLPRGNKLVFYMEVFNGRDEMIASNGTLRVEIFRNDVMKWSETYQIDQKDFWDTTIGMGIFERPATIWVADRIPYNSIEPGLKDLAMEKPVYLNVRAYFEIPGNETLSDSDLVFIS